MADLRILNSKERKKIRQQLEEQFGFRGELDHVFLLNEKKQKLYFFTKDLEHAEYDDLKIDTMGLYVGAFFEGKIRMTIDGAQLIGPDCTKNIVVINKKEMQDWIRGMKLEIPNLSFKDSLPEEESFVIIRHENDFLGCGKISQGAITNYIPKTRYVHALYD